jgi:molybdopterin adenylyltransferase
MTLDSRTIHARFGIVTVSDRASAGTYDDLGGPAIAKFLGTHVSTPHELHQRLVPDDTRAISSAIVDLVDQVGSCMVVTTGGTGPARRDVTPEATEAICDKLLPGFGELMRRTSLEHTPTAILSRQTAGIRGDSVIINLPGKPSSIAVCLSAVLPAVPYCIDLLGGPRIELGGGLVAFRPPGP